VSLYTSVTAKVELPRSLVRGMLHSP